MSSLICLIFTIISRSCFCRGLLYTSKNILNQKNLSYFNWSNFFLERTWLDFHYLFPQPPLSPSPFLFLTYLGPKKKQHQKHQKTTLNKLAHNMVKIRLKKRYQRLIMIRRLFGHANSLLHFSDSTALSWGWKRVVEEVVIS